MSKLTVFSYGVGQDSTAILVALLRSKSFRETYAPNDLIVVTADTKNERPETYVYLKFMKMLCKEHNVPFFVLDPKDYASGDWKDGLIGFYRAKKAVGSKAFPKTCTDRLKIRPIYNFLEEYVHKTYETDKYGRKSALYEFTEKYGKIDVLIGIAKGEEKRATENGTSGIKWFDTCIMKRYPLLDLGLDRKQCQDYIKFMGYDVPLPSNCILCPFMSLQELLYLYRYDRANFNLWLDLEAEKLKANKNLGSKNLGVWGKPETLLETVKLAIEKHGHTTKEELIEYRMSHGHCVMSKY